MSQPSWDPSAYVKDTLSKLQAAALGEGDADAVEFVDLLFRFMHEVSVGGPLEEEYEQWFSEVQAAWCKHIGSHDWIYDHCGFWGHQFCVRCHLPKYTEMPDRCSEAGDLVKITEEEYLKRMPVAGEKESQSDHSDDMGK